MKSVELQQQWNTGTANDNICAQGSFSSVLWWWVVCAKAQHEGDGEEREPKSYYIKAFKYGSPNTHLLARNMQGPMQCHSDTSSLGM